MRKFIKGCIVAGLICLLAGGVIAAVSVAMGGTLTDVIPLRLKQWGIKLGEYTKETFWDNNEFEYDSDYQELESINLLPFEEEEIDISSQGNQIYSASGIRKLETDISAGRVRIVEDSQGEEITIFCNKGADYYQIEENEGKLILETYSKKGNYHEPKLLFTIHIPKNYQFTSVDIEVEPENVRYGDRDKKVGFIADGLLADELNLDIKAGLARIRNGNAGTVLINSEAGAVNYSGNVLSHVTLDCEASAVNLELEGKKEDFRYYVNSSLGAIKLGDESLFLFDKAVTRNTNAPKSMDLDCEVSAVQITFMNQES